jgi:hypothetical protein
MPSPPNDQYAILGHRLGFRLAYQPAELRRARETWVTAALDGQYVKIRRNSVTIHDVINDTPNTCQVTVDAATPPVINQRLTIRINSNAPRTLFAGPLQTVGLSYELQPHQTVYDCAAIDDTPVANRRLPFGTWTDTSASEIATYLVVSFCPAGFSTAGVQANLPAVAVNFDSSEGMDGCLRQLAKLIGGYFYWEERTLHLFTTEALDPPDPIDATHPFLASPPIHVATETSQIRTRVYGKGHGEQIVADVSPNSPTVPISNAVMFNPAGGQATTGTQRLRYTGTDLGGGGSLVGPGIGPSASPALAALDGYGVTPGPHWYTVTYKTAAGESLIGPGNFITVASRAAPTTPVTFPKPNAFVASGGVDPGDHSYAYTDVTAAGETLPGPSLAITVRAVPPPPANFAPLIQRSGPTNNGVTPQGKWVIGATVSFQFAYSNIDGQPYLNETVLSISSPSVVLPEWAPGGGSFYSPITIQVPYSNDPLVKYIHVWGFVLSGPAGGDTVQRYCGTAQNYVNGGSGPWIDCGNHGDIPYPGANPNLKQVTVTVPATADPNVTNRNLYRTTAGTAQLKYRVTFGPSGGTLDDTLPDASLGVNVITTPTAAAQRIALSGIPLGASGVIARNIYRTAVTNQALYKLVATLGDNTTTTYLDTAADAALGVSPPTGDTSGLKQPDGVVLAGAPSIVVAGAGWARPLGGWAVIGNGEVVFRYTGISGNALTGIPTFGPGAITATVSYGSTITAAAMLLGVTNLALGLIKGAGINLWIERNDLTAQAALTARDGSDGIIEHLITDERRGETSLTQLCDADLKQYAYPIQTVTYATRDSKTKSGKPIAFNLASPMIQGTLTIQEVTITEINYAVGLPPRFTVTASSVRFSLEDILRRLGGSLDVTT